MFDIGVSKLMIVGGIALIVIGPERLPRVARMVGTMVGRAQRYVAEVKAEVNRSIELEELKKMRDEFDQAARGVDESIRSGVQQAASEIHQSWKGEPGVAPPPTPDAAPPAYRHPGKKWRMKRGAVPRWYKQRNGVRLHVQSGAARVARFRPPGVRR
jgi:sec-independent protein translocase protein TatB